MSVLGGANDQVEAGDKSAPLIVQGRTGFPGSSWKQVEESLPVESFEPLHLDMGGRELEAQAHEHCMGNTLNGCAGAYASVPNFLSPNLALFLYSDVYSS